MFVQAPDEVTAFVAPRGIGQLLKHEIVALHQEFYVSEVGHLDVVAEFHPGGTDIHRLRNFHAFPLRPSAKRNGFHEAAEDPA